MKFRKLGRTGLEVSVLSFGASSLGSVFRETSDRESIKTVHAALMQASTILMFRLTMD